jgi:hypothetical protein
MFTDVANPFGAVAYEPAAYELSRTLYYKGQRLHKLPRSMRAPKPLSHIIKNFLLNYNG